MNSPFRLLFCFGILIFYATEKPHSVIVKPTKGTTSPVVFKAILIRHGIGMSVEFPLGVEKLFGTRGQVKVRATFDGHPYRGSLAPMGGQKHVIGIRKDIAAAIGKNPGDVINVTIQLDTEERVVDVPPSLQKLLGKNKKANTFFQSLSYSNRKEYAVWISSAVKEETRDRRLILAIEKLNAEKKNPSE